MTKTVGKVSIVVQDVNYPPAIAIPLLAWLTKNSISAEYQSSNSDRDGWGDIRLWALKDDTLSDVNPEPGKDFALAALAPDGFDVIHPAVSISKITDAKFAISEFDDCTWMVGSSNTKEIAKSTLKISEDKLLLLDTSQKRVAYHLALCLVVPEVFTLFELARDVLKGAGIESETWLAVNQTGKRAASRYVDGHYHGPASRGDRQSLAIHFDFLKKKAPWILPLYHELIQYRIARRAIDNKKFDDLGIGKTLWDNKSTHLEITENKPFDGISDDAAKDILEELESLIPCTPLLLSVTFFQLEAGSREEPLKVGLSGQGFALYWSSKIYDSFKEQIAYFLNEIGHNGISKEISTTDVNNIKPFLVVPETKKENILSDFFRVVASGGSNSEPYGVRKDESEFQKIKFGLEAESQQDHLDHTSSCPCDGWFPIKYSNVTEMVIPLFRFNTGDMKPILEGLVTIIGAFDELARLTPARISEIQSLALRRYMATGHLERGIIEAVRMNELEWNEPGKMQFEKLGNYLDKVIFTNGALHEISGHTVIPDNITRDQTAITLLKNALEKRVEINVLNLWIGSLSSTEKQPNDWFQSVVVAKAISHGEFPILWLKSFSEINNVDDRDVGIVAAEIYALAIGVALNDLKKNQFNTLDIEAKIDKDSIRYLQLTVTVKQDERYKPESLLELALDVWSDSSEARKGLTTKSLKKLRMANSYKKPIYNICQDKAIFTFKFLIEQGQ